MVFSVPFQQRCSRLTTNQLQEHIAFSPKEFLGICTKELLLHECMSWLEDRKLLRDQNLQAWWLFLLSQWANFGVLNLYEKFCGYGGRQVPRESGKVNFGLAEEVKLILLLWYTSLSQILNIRILSIKTFLSKGLP